MRTLTRALVSFAVLGFLPGTAYSQSVVGGLAGRVESRQIRDRGEDSSSRTGYMTGAFIDVPTPVGPLSILAEALFAQRGGQFDEDHPEIPPGQVRADVLGFTVAPTLRARAGAASVYGYAGPMVEIPVHNRYTSDLAAAYRFPSGQIFAVTAGGGVGVALGAWTARLEARVVEELSSAFSSDAGDFRHRSKEILVRVGKFVAR